MEKNKVLDFIDQIHTFERENNVFELKDDDLLYYDLFRLNMMEILFYKYFNDQQDYHIVQANKSPSSIIQKILKVLRFGYSSCVNSLNFHFYIKKNPYLFLKITRFYDSKSGKAYDAAMEDIYSTLKGEATQFETFKNIHTDKIKLGNDYQCFHLYTLKRIKRKLNFKKKNTYKLTSLINSAFPFAKDEDWNKLIQYSIIDFNTEKKFAHQIFIKAQPNIFFFTGGAKGYIAAANILGIKTVEVQHSPLNKADIQYSYHPDIDYSALITVPNYLLTNSEIWNSKVFYPAKFINVGSNYFYNSSKFIEQVKDSYLFVSDITNHEILKQLVLQFHHANITNGPLKIVFKLHSAETDRYHDVKNELEKYPGISVILNEENISDLLDRSIESFMIYSTVAYQALQKGLTVNLLKIGYYEGAYDLFDLPQVRLINPKELEAKIEINVSTVHHERVHFFEPFNPSALNNFLQAID